MPSRRIQFVVVQAKKASRRFFSKNLRRVTVFPSRKLRIAMVLIGQGQAGRNVPNTTATATTIAIQAPVSRTCCCSTPQGASPAVTRPRGVAIAIIVFHSIALAAIGYINWAQWLGSLAGIIMGSVLLCVFQRACYITAAVVFAVGGIFDIVAMVFWIRIAQAFDEYGENATYYSTTYTTSNGYYYYYYYTYTTSDVDATTDEWGEIASGLAVPPAIAALLMFIGTTFAINAVMTWDQNGTPAGPKIVETTYPTREAVVHTTIAVNALPLPAANGIGAERPPPPYTG